MAVQCWADSEAAVGGKDCQLPAVGRVTDVCEFSLSKPLVLEFCSPHPHLLRWFIEAVTMLCVCSRNIQVDSPYDISRAPDELHYTYLDTFGRPVIVAYKKNLVEQHIQDIVVSGSAACCWDVGSGFGLWI